MEWIDVKLRKPAIGHNVLVYAYPEKHCYYGIFIASYTGKNWEDFPGGMFGCETCGCGEVTH